MGAFAAGEMVRPSSGPEPANPMAARGSMSSPPCSTSCRARISSLVPPLSQVPEFDSYCFSPETPLDAIGVVDSEFGTHLVRLEKQNLGVAEGKSQKIKGRRMLDTPNPTTGLRS